MDFLPDTLLSATLAAMSRRPSAGFRQALVCRRWSEEALEVQQELNLFEKPKNGGADLALELAHLPGLRRFSLKVQEGSSWWCLSEAEFSTIVQSLASHCLQLTAVHLPEFEWRHATIGIVNRMFLALPRLCEFSIGGARFPEGSFLTLLSLLRLPSSLRFLSLREIHSEKESRPTGPWPLDHIFTSLTSLRHLHLELNKWGHAWPPLAFNGLSGLRTLRLELYLGCDVGDWSMPESFGELLSLKELRLSHISGDSITLVSATPLKELPLLRLLSVEMFSLEPDAWETIQELTDLTHLEVLTADLEVPTPDILRHLKLFSLDAKVPSDSVSRMKSLHVDSEVGLECLPHAKKLQKLHLEQPLAFKCRPCGDVILQPFCIPQTLESVARTLRSLTISAPITHQSFQVLGCLGELKELKIFLITSSNTSLFPGKLGKLRSLQMEVEPEGSPSPHPVSVFDCDTACRLPEDFFQGLDNLEDLEICAPLMCCLPKSTSTLLRLRRLVLWQEIGLRARQSIPDVSPAVSTLPNLNSIEVKVEDFKVLYRVPWALLQMPQLGASTREQLLHRRGELLDMDELSVYALPPTMDCLLGLKSLTLGSAWIPPDIVRCSWLTYLELSVALKKRSFPPNWARQKA